MPDYTQLAKNTLATIRKNGRMLPLTRPGDTVDPITGQVTAGTATSGTMAGLTLPLKKSAFGQGYDVAMKEGGGVLSNWRYILGAADGATFTPELLDEFAFDGATWTIKAITTLSPAGVALIHKIAVVKK